jgi:hypothetical protein
LKFGEDEFSTNFNIKDSFSFRHQFNITDLHFLQFCRDTLRIRKVVSHGTVDDFYFHNFTFFMRNYLPDAERVSAELKEMKISDIELVPEGKGIFDVEIGGKLIFSIFQSGRFPGRGEIPGLISHQDSIKGIANSPDASCC